jgi:Na+-driven multidrug efflux pump
LLGKHFYGIAGIFAAYAAANVITGFVAYAWVRKKIRGLCPQTA